MGKEFLKKVIAVQQKLKAPKGQRNNYGNYSYRSCEDILEAVKPLLKESELYLSLSDEIVNIGNRFYVKSTVTISDGENSISNVAYAREAESRKGYDESQITGSASSYARKYALNGLFAIDDTKDADTLNNSADYTQQNDGAEQAIQAVNKATSIEALQKVWNDNPTLQKSRKFIQAVNARKSTLKTA